MVPVNYRPPEHMPLDLRDFPPRAQRTERSNELGLMVVGYLAALFAGIVLLGLSAPPPPNVATAEIMAGR
jgi:hypothetical protein